MVYMYILTIMTIVKATIRVKISYFNHENLNCYRLKLHTLSTLDVSGINVK